MSLRVIVGWVSLGAAAVVAGAPAPPDPVDFSSEIRPILSAKCYPCHGPDEAARKGGLRLDLFAEATREHKHGTPIVAGDPARSELVARLGATDPDELMPPPEAKNPIKPAERASLARWIAQGAKYSPHWAWTKPVRPPRPQVAHRSWPRNGLDYFVLAKLEQHGWAPAPEADRRTLARRLSLDLTGLPPDPAVVDAFVRDRSRQAYEKLVDFYLALPAYGERWARVWLDLARYADSAGYGSDPLRTTIWPWRDWLIRALNRNEGFDEFTRDMIAGDLLPHPDRDQVVATAFHRNTMTNTEGGTDDEEYRVAAVKDRANVTAQVWMGLTLGCAQCHSHKYDPISQTDYYSFFGLFNQTEDNDQPDERPTLPLYSPAEEAARAQLKSEITAGEALLAGSGPETDALWQGREGPPPLVFAIAAKRRALDHISGIPLPVMREVAADKRRKTHLLNKGNFLDPGPEVEAAVLSSFHALPSGQTPNRLGLAAWLTSPDNPLTARVAVNRYWGQLLGRPIVETEEDFGTQGALPSNQALLDFLAVSFEESPRPNHESDPNAPGFHWDVKALIRYIVTSATYRQSSTGGGDGHQQDPGNRFYSRGTRRRLDAETIRDQALALSGLLSRKIGGPSVYPAQPEGLWRAAFNGERTWSTSAGEDRYRRGIYTFWRRTVPYPSLATFDAPSREACALKRQPTNTPLQAYVTLNDPAFVEAAQALGRRLAKRPGPVESQVAWGLELALCKAADPRMVATLARLFREEREAYAGRTGDALKLATDPLGPLPPEIEIAEAAAWTVVSNVLLNLDDVLVNR